METRLGAELVIAFRVRPAAGTRGRADARTRRHDSPPSSLSRPRLLRLSTQSLS